MRRYGYQNFPEDTDRCVVDVPDRSSVTFYQCSRKRGYGPGGLYCKQHAKMVEQNPGSVSVPRDVSEQRKGK